MAKARVTSPDFQPGLSETPVATHVDQGFVEQRTAEKGIVNTSTAETIAFWGGQAAEAHKGYREAKLETEIENNIIEFLQERDVPTVYDETDVGYNEDEKMALRSAEEDYRKLRRARVSGAKSSLELDIMLENITKRHINNMPGLATEFRNILSQQKGDASGKLSAVVAQEKAAAAADKQQDAIKKSIMTSASKMGYDVIGTPWEAWYAKYLEDTGALQDVANIKAAREMNAIKAEDMRNSSTALPKYLKGSLVGLNTELRRIINNPNDKNEFGEGKEAQVLNAIIASKEDIAYMFPPIPGGGKEDARITGYLKSIESLQKIYTEEATGVLDEQRLRRRVNIHQMTVEAGFYDDPKLARLMAAAKYLGPSLQGMAVQEEMSNAVVKYLERAANEEALSVLGPPKDRTQTEKQAALTYLKTLNTWTSKVSGDKSGDPGVELEEEALMGAIKKTVMQWENGEDRATLDELMSLAANPDIISILEKNDADGTVRKRMENISDSYVGKLVSNRFNDEFKAGAMEIVVRDEDGSFYVRAIEEDPETVKAVANLNSQYVKQMNTYNRVKAHMQGTEDYASGMKQYARVLNAVAEMTAATVDKETGEKVPLQPSEVTEENVNNVVRLVPSYEEPGIFGAPGTNTEGPSKGAQYAFVPTFYDMWYGEDVNDFDVVMNHMGQVFNGLDYVMQARFLNDIAKWPHFKKFMQFVGRKDKNGNRVWGNADDVKGTVRRIGKNDISQDEGTVPKPPEVPEGKVEEEKILDWGSLTQ